MSLESDKRVLAANLTHPLLYKKVCFALHSTPFKSIDSSSQPSSLQRPSISSFPTQPSRAQTSQPLISFHSVSVQRLLHFWLLIVWNGFTWRLVLCRRVSALTTVQARVCRNTRKLFRTWVVLLEGWMPVLPSYDNVFLFRWAVAASCCSSDGSRHLTLFGHETGERARSEGLLGCAR